MNLYHNDKNTWIIWNVGLCTENTSKSILYDVWNIELELSSIRNLVNTKSKKNSYNCKRVINYIIAASLYRVIGLLQLKDSLKNYCIMMQRYTMDERRERIPLSGVEQLAGNQNQNPHLGQSL